MAPTHFAGLTLMWILLLSDHSVRGRVAPMNAGLVSNNENIPVSSRYHDNITMERLLPRPRNSHDEMLARGDNRISHWAVLQAHGEYDNVLATLNVYGVPVKGTQISSTIVSISTGADGPLEHIEAVQFGWHVWPEYYGDYDTHFFISWTRGGHKNTGCLNLDCKGFVFDNQSLYRPGNKLKPVSDRNGTRYSITVRIAREPMGRWYLYYGSEWHKPIGYWPCELFNNLYNSGSRVDIGGNVQFNRGEPGPPMGSGFLPADAGKAAFIRAQYINDNRDTVPLLGNIYADKGGYYSMARSNDDYYYYGGPGGCID